MRTLTKCLVILAVLLLPACAWLNDSTRIKDPHAPKTVIAGEQGGQVRLDHGERLRIRLPADAASGYEWRRVEPQILMVMVEGPPNGDLWSFTPVRTGNETLRFEYRRARDESTAAQRAVTYEITVR